MSASDFLAWHDFFAVVAQVGATLAGLLFVGLTISLEHLLAARGYLGRAFAALYLQLQILLIGIFGLIPAQPAWALGTELFVTGASFLAGISVFTHYFPEDEKSYVMGSPGMQRLRVFFNIASTSLPALSGLALLLGIRGALYILIPAVVTCVYVSIGYAWAFAVEIPRRQKEKP